MDCKKCKQEIPEGALACAECCLRSSEGELLPRFNRAEYLLWTARVAGVTHVAVARHADPFCREQWKGVPAWKRATRGEMEEQHAKRPFCDVCALRLRLPEPVAVSR